MRAVFVTLACAVLFPAAGATGPVDYLRDVKPILSSRCTSCHGALRQRSGLRLDTASLIRQGGKTGTAIVPGKSADSLLIAAVTGNGRPRMPPAKEGAALTAEQIAVLKAWIDQGAPSPDEPVPEDPRRHWAFRPPERAPLPQVAQPEWVRNPIDAFVAAEHDKHGLLPRPPAPKELLLRRVYLDLTGLPPTREELHAFLADDSAGAYERVVDRLLASPQYGERWGRHWMDVWRYSDWYGRRAVPDWWNSATQIWRWRDWIGRSLNRDKGYDRMVLEMLAADEVAPEDDEAVVATGFIARNWYALNYNQWLRDEVEHTGKAFLGLTLNCAHCHDHKYDPITQEEYFRFRAFFEPIELRQDRVHGEPDPGPFQKYEYTVLHKPVKSGSIRVFDERPNAPTIMYSLGDERNVIDGRPPVTPGAPAFLGGDRLTIAPVELPPAAYYPGLKPFVQQEETAKRGTAAADARDALAKVDRKSAEAVRLAEARLAAAEAELKSIQARIAADNAAYRRTPGDPVELAKAASKADRAAAFCAAQEKLLQAEQGLSAVKAKGDAAVKQAEQQVAALRKAAEAAREALKADGTKYTPLSPVYPKTSTGRRTALARWITARDNPLTARVAVNQVWMRHFGKPLVETVFDFGRNGKRPTHPELLDWLAVEFMESGWSLKHLHRLIVTSSTYRMDSAAGPSQPNLASDPDNRWLWHFPPHRMEAEVVRDSILSAAGELDPRMGGPELENDQAAASRRRSLYFSIHPEDGGAMKFVELFDAPNPCDCYRRSESLIPQQALALTNGDLPLSASRLLAGRLGEQLDEAAFVAAAFEQVLSRRPSEAEQAVCLAFLRKQADLYQSAAAKPQAGQTPAGEVPPSADPRMRARESLVRTLFSHNDFVTIR